MAMPLFEDIQKDRPTDSLHKDGQIYVKPFELFLTLEMYVVSAHAQMKLFPSA